MLILHLGAPILHPPSPLYLTPSFRLPTQSCSSMGPSHSCLSVTALRKQPFSQQQIGLREIIECWAFLCVLGQYTDQHKINAGGQPFENSVIMRIYKGQLGQWFICVLNVCSLYVQGKD